MDSEDCLSGASRAGIRGLAQSSQPIRAPRTSQLIQASYHSGGPIEPLRSLRSKSLSPTKVDKVDIAATGNYHTSINTTAIIVIHAHIYLH